MNPEIINDGGLAKRKLCGGGRAFHSRLEPFVDFIREQRQRRRTWQEIAAVLFSETGCAITAQGVHQFFGATFNAGRKRIGKKHHLCRKRSPLKPSSLRHRRENQFWPRLRN